MYISNLRIRNFRNFSNSTFLFKKGVNTIIGENGVGKTNALYALRLLLDDSLSRNAIRLNKDDFTRNTKDWRGNWIVISVEFKNLDASEGCQMLKHETGHMDTSDDGTLTLFFRPNLEVRRKFYNASGDKEAIEKVIDSITIEHYEPILTGRSETDFTDAQSYIEFVGDFETGIFPNPDIEKIESYGVPIRPIHNEVSLTFVKALRDAVSELRRYKNSPLLKLLTGAGSKLPKEDAENIALKVKELNIEIADLEDIKAISSGIQKTLHSTVGYTFSPSVKIESSLSEEIENLFQNLTLSVGDNLGDGYSGDLHHLSLGGANLIYLALKLLEYEREISAEKVAQFLVIEEPEAHIHNHIQKTIFENHGINKTQVILSTHSTHISSASKIPHMNIIGMKGNDVEVYQPSHNLNPKICSRIERYLDVARSPLLFAKGVILVEGDAELVLIPALVKAALGVSLDELGVSLINMNCAFFENIAILFMKIESEETAQSLRTMIYQ